MCIGVCPLALARRVRGPMTRYARESATAAWLVTMRDGVGGGGGDGGSGDGGVRVCVVVLLGVLSMRRAAVIGKSIPDGTNQLALRSTVIRTRRLTVRRRAPRDSSLSSRESRESERRGKRSVVKKVKGRKKEYENIMESSVRKFRWAAIDVDSAAWRKKGTPTVVLYEHGIYRTFVRGVRQ